MKIKIYASLAVILITVFFSACKKEEVEQETSAKRRKTIVLMGDEDTTNPGSGGGGETGPGIPGTPGSVTFGVPDNTSIGYEVESNDVDNVLGTYQGTRKVSWYCYTCIKGSESIRFISLDRINYSYTISDFIAGSFYRKTHFLTSMEHLNMTVIGKIEGQVSTPVYLDYNDLTTPNLAKINIVFQEKREAKRPDNSISVRFSEILTSTKGWDKSDVGLKDIN